MDSNRRLFLVSLASGAALAACSGSSLLQPSTLIQGSPQLRRHGALTMLPLMIVNDNPTIKDADIWLTYFGELPGTNTFVHAELTSKGVEIVNNVSSNGKAINFSFKATPGKLMDLPLLKGWRLYVSIGKGMQVVIPANTLNPDAGTAGSASNPNLNTVFDFFEGNFDPASGVGPLLTIDLSNVQSANIPMSYSISGTEPSTKQPITFLYGWKPGGWTAFLASLKGLKGDDAVFADLILPTTGRVLEPGEAIGPGTVNVFKNADYLKSYIDAVWTHFTTKQMNIKLNDGSTWVGQVKAGNLVFTPPSSNFKAIPFRQPTTKEVFQCALKDACTDKSACNTQTGDPGGQITFTLQAAFNRSVQPEDLEDISTTPGSTSCFKGFWYKTSPTNYYAKFAHENSYEKKAYAFPSDDTCSVDNLTHTVNTKPPFTITLVTP